MEMSPQRVRTAAFKTVRKGVDPAEIEAFLAEVADELERAQNQSTAMEARARAAVARLQEMTDGKGAPAAPAVSTPDVSVDEAETISRTLLLAQRTADSTVAEARAEAARIVQAANAEASTALDSAREMSTRLTEEARAAARQAGEAERITVAGEVDALKARRDFLESDVEQLELFLTDQRSQLREAATALVDIAERVPGGLGASRPPLLSASDDDDAEPTSDADAIGDDADADADVDADADIAVDGVEADADEAPDDLLIVTDLADTPAGGDAEDVTEAIPSTTSDAGDDADQANDREQSEEILFSFDDDRR